MNSLTGTITILFSVCNLVFNFWWLALLPASTTRSKRREPNIMGELLGRWLILVVIRVVLVFNPEPLINMVIPEPLNTLIFVLVGVGLFTLNALIQRRKRQRFLQKTGEVNSVADLLALSPTEFEDMVVELYQMAGHQAKRTGAVGDNGVDIVVQAKNGEKWIVQCKRWKGSVGAPVVRDFYGAMQHEKADKGTIIAAGRFSKPAVEWSKGKPISLYDGEKFLDAWRRAKKQQAKVQRRAEATG